MDNKSKKPDLSQMLLFLTEPNVEEHTSDYSEIESTSSVTNELKPEDVEKKSRKGEAHTAWHPLFAEVLGIYLPEGYRLLTEYQLTLAPQRIDVVVWDEVGKQGKIQGLPAIMEHLTDYNLFEFKSPLDTVEAGDYTNLVSYAMQYRNKERKKKTFSMKELSLFLVAPQWTEGLHQEMKEWDLQPQQIQPGVYKLDDHWWNSWFLEINVLGEQPANEALGLFSEQFAKDPTRWGRKRSVPLELIVWLIQQLANYRERSCEMPLLYSKEFQEQMQKAVREYVASLDNKELQLAISGEKRQSFLLSLPSEDRLKDVPVAERLKDVPVEDVLKAVPVEDVLKAVPVEDVLKAVPVEDVLKAVPVEDRLKGLTPEERATLKKLLD